MTEEPQQLVNQAASALSCLPLGGGDGDVNLPKDVPIDMGVIQRKREHVGGLVHPAMSSVETAYFLIGDKYEIHSGRPFRLSFGFCDQIKQRLEPFPGETCFCLSKDGQNHPQSA